jgi:hypothetical protein
VPEIITVSEANADGDDVAVGEDVDEEDGQQQGLALELLNQADRELIERVMQGIARMGGVLASEGVDDEEKASSRETLQRACQLLEEGEVEEE